MEATRAAGYVCVWVVRPPDPACERRIKHSPRAINEQKYIKSKTRKKKKTSLRRCWRVALLHVRHYDRAKCTPGHKLQYTHAFAPPHTPQRMQPGAYTKHIYGGGGGTQRRSTPLTHLRFELSNEASCGRPAIFRLVFHPEHVVDRRHRVRDHLQSGEGHKPTPKHRYTKGTNDIIIAVFFSGRARGLKG